MARSAFYEPFVGVAFQLSFWGATDVDGEYVEEGCLAYGDRRVTPAMCGQLGLAFEPSRHFGLEIGADATLTLEGSVFNDEGLDSSPFVGGTVYD